KFLVPFVVGMDGNGRVAQHSFWTGGGHYQLPASVSQRVANMPQVPLLLLVKDFYIGKSRTVKGAEVYQSLAPVNQSFVPHFFERLISSGHDFIVERKNVPAPIYSCPKPAEL